MKTVFVVWALFFSVVSHAQCRPQDWVLQDFVRAPGALANCSYPLYHANGSIAYAPDTRNWYHSNGAIAYWSASGNWYHPNGSAAFWARTRNWYHQNGEAAYWAQTRNWFHSNRQPAYWAANGFWYHANNAIAYNAQTGSWYYANGTFAGTSYKVEPYQAVEFIVNESCQTSSSVLCFVARFR